MGVSDVLRSAIGIVGVFVLSTPLALAVPPTDGTAEPTATTHTVIQQDSSSEPADAQRCRYKPLPGSHIKVHVCTSPVEYRMDRKARTIAVVIPGSGGVPIAAPLPQVQ
jgi:hypothetical protein